MFRPLTLLVSMAAVALAITPALSQDPAAPAAAPGLLPLQPHPLKRQVPHRQQHPAAVTKTEFKTKVTFTSEAPLERIEGTAEGKGSLAVDLNAPGTVTGSISVGVATMKTGNDRRDAHLRGDKWLNAEKFPDITFAVSQAKAEPTETKGEVKSAKMTVTGTFSLHGVSKELTAPAVMKWKGNKVKITTKFQVALADYAVQGAQGVVGDKVANSISVDVTLLGAVK